MNSLLIGVITLFVGILGWSQIIGSLQNIKNRPNLIIALILWLVIMIGLGYYFIVQKNAFIPTLIGYAVSLVMVLSQGKIS